MHFYRRVGISCTTVSCFKHLFLHEEVGVDVAEGVLLLLQTSNMTSLSSGQQNGWSRTLKFPSTRRVIHC
jgi:hypothetical protein